MGFEYRIVVSLSPKDKIEVKRICLKYKSNLKDFRFDFDVKDCEIYICRFDKPVIWKDLEDLRDYIQKRKLKFEIEEI